MRVWQVALALSAVVAGTGLLVFSKGAPGAEDPRPFAGREIEAFVGSASKPPTEAAAARFEALTGARVLLHLGGSGQMLTSLKLSGRGDLYFPGSSDFMALAVREGLVREETERRVVYLVPAINVAPGNPRGLHTLEDLARPGIRVGIARPDTVCVGLYGVEVLERAGLAERVRPNVVTWAESCERTAQLLALGAVDAVLGWEVFASWDPTRIETVLLPPEQVPRLGYIPIAMARSAKDPEVAQAFIDFLLSAEGQALYRQWGYLTTEEQARAHALFDTPVGGEWELPASWR